MAPARVVSRILSRSESLFATDLDASGDALHGAIGGRRMVVVGAGGSIGRAFVRRVAAFQPSALALVDISENTLVELIRELRASPEPLPKDLATYSVALGSLEFQRLLDALPPFDYVINFAAMKHVRSERDPYSLMRMIDTNVLAVDTLTASLRADATRKVFSVSTDKAVRPASLMGATKRWMERVLFTHADRMPCSTARFANVAFSDGSLLAGFLQRLAKQQPLAAPTDVRRYFISEEEAGQLCLLACFAGGNREVYFPRLEPTRHLLSLAEIAGVLLEELGMRAEVFASEDEARRSGLLTGEPPTAWPCVFSATDTTGEKLLEEFFTEEDQPDFSRYRAIGVITEGALPDTSGLAAARAAVERVRGERQWRKADLIEAIRLAVPELQHTELHRSLDAKM
ncbi:MAG: polysaccharide biosynthesis protein [Candidatus Rokuibacteriota bacterium]